MNEPLLPGVLGKLRERELFVNELFTSIQGESTHAGRPCYFIRLAGCHLRCSWCDTAYAFHEGRVLTIEDCVEGASRSGFGLVEVTGGEPLLQKAVYVLLAELCDRGFEVLLETSGSLPIDRVDPRVRRIVDWKCPGSGMSDRNHPPVIAQLKGGDELKFVLKDRADYEWAKDWLHVNCARLPREVPVLFSPVFGELPPATLASWIIEDRLQVRLNLQLHKWIWGPSARGV